MKDFPKQPTSIKTVQMDGIYKIVRRQFYLYVYVGSFRYFLIPKREVEPNQLKEFESELRRRVEAAK